MTVAIQTIPTKKKGCDKEFYRVREVVGKDKEKAEVYTILWDSLHETKHAAIKEIETVSGKTLDQFSYKSAMGGFTICI